MSEIIEWLKEEASIDSIAEHHIFFHTKYNGEDVIYSIDKIKTKFKVHQLQVNGPAWVVLNIKELWVEFAVFEFAESEMNGENPKGQLIFHGEGPSGNLRECRHTWWGDNGYVFYPSGDVITAAFQVLSEYFDGMIK